MKPVKLLAALLFISVALAGCAAQPDRLWLKSPDWSRAKLVGNTRVGAPVQIAIDDKHSSYLFFIQSQEDRPFPRVVAFNEDGNLAWDRSFNEMSLQLPADPQILWDGYRLLLFWVNEYQLYGATMGTDGEWLDPPTIVSGDRLVDTLATAVDPNGSLSVWFSTPLEKPGLYSIRNPLNDPTIELIDPNGTNPDLIYDEEGTLHAVWARIPNERGMNDFVYGVYSTGAYEPGQARKLTSPIVYGTSVLEGPKLGVDSRHTFVFWSVTFYSGPEAGTVRAQYVYVPRGEFEPISTPRVLSVPWSHDLIYEEQPEALLDSGRRVLLEPAFNGGGTYIVQINPNHQFADELVLAFQARLGYLMRKVQSQVSVAYLNDGHTSSYQELSFSQSQSSTPFVISDDRNYLHLSWLEKGTVPGWAIYYTSTSPGSVHGFGGLSVDDISRVSIEVLFGLAIGALLIPIAIAWVLPSGLALLISLRAADRLFSHGEWAKIAALSLSILILWVAKFGILPGISSYVPFSAWIPFLPTKLAPILRISVPILIFGISLFGAWRFTRLSEEKPVVQFFLIYCIIDGVLSMAVYGGLIFATF